MPRKACGNTLLQAQHERPEVVCRLALRESRMSLKLERGAAEKLALDSASQLATLNAV